MRLLIVKRYMLRFGAVVVQAARGLVIAREGGRSSNPGDAAKYWIPAFAGMTPENW
jgi:hypothetical protein